MYDFAESSHSTNAHHLRILSGVLPYICDEIPCLTER